MSKKNTTQTNKKDRSNRVKENFSELDELRRENRELREMVDRLSIDPSYGILTRQALELEVSLRKKEFNKLAFLDVDYLHDFNENHGHEEANNRIRRALHFRSTDLAGIGNRVTGKYYSGDEVAILFDGDPEGFCKRQEEAFESEGMSITIAWVEFTGNFDKAVKAAKKIVFEKKAARGVSER